jgi:hypothetical protein
MNTSLHPVKRCADGARASRCKRSAAIVLTVLMFGVLGSSVPASASTEEAAVNGTFAVTSNGEFATTNDIYRDEAIVRSTWTIASTCVTRTDCSGTVTSDQGWTEPIRKSNHTWIVDHEIPNWEPCPDGTAAPGHQQFRFQRVDDTGHVDLTDQSGTFAGHDRTAGPSGACGINQPLVIKMPLRLDKIG